MPITSRSVRTIAASLTCFVALPAAAQQRDTTAADSARRLAPIVSTATRAPARADELPQRIKTITRADLERTPVNDAVDALKKLAGVDVIQYPSLLGYVSIRGFRPSSSTQTRTLILVDGRPAGSYNLSLLDMSSVERVEVLKGPASAIYGSSAVGGVVNFITRRSVGRPTGSISASYGSFAWSELAAQGGGVLARPNGYAIDADLSARRWQQGDDYRVGRGGIFRGAIGGETALKSYPNSTRASREVADTTGDGLVRGYTTFVTTSGSARVGVALPGAFRVDVRGELFGADDVLSPGDVYARLSQFPGDGRKNVGRHSEEITLQRVLPDSLRSSGLSHAPLARVFSARETSESFDSPADAGFVNYASVARTQGAQLQDVIRFGAQSLTIGADATRIDDESQRWSRTGTTITEIGTYSPNARATSTAAFAQAQLRSPGGRVTGVLGGRLDRVALELRETPFRSDVTAGTDRFTIFNPNAGVQVELVRGLRAHATAGRAFLNPGASALAGFSKSVNSGVASITVGNPNLSPEQSVTVDGGLAFVQPARGLSFDVTYFSTQVENRISSARATFPAGRRPTTAAGEQISSITTSANAGEARLRGFEAEARWDVGMAMRRAWSLGVFANATRLLRAEETTPAVVVDTAGLASVQNIDATVVFDRVRLDESRITTLRIKNVANFNAVAGIDFDDLRRITGRLSARYVGKRLDSDFSDAVDPGDIEYAPFLVLDLTAGVRVANRLRIEGLVGNLTDENYYEKRGYNLPGRTLRLRLTADF